jgi:hypothetical protein
LGLTYVNQVGAVEGINQAAPGSFISETNVRWAQDILFDRVGYLRRRAPFEIFDLYNNSVPPSITQPSTPNERIITVVSTLDPSGNRIVGLVLGTSTNTRILFYNENFRNTGSSTLNYTFPSDMVYDCKPASNGGMWLSFMESYKAASSSNEYYQYYWFGGNGVEEAVNNINLGHTVGTPNSKHSTYTNILTRSAGTFDTAKITPGMFVYVTYNSVDYYIGMVKNVTSAQVTLDKDIIRFTPDANITTVSPSAITGLTVKFYNVRPYIHAHGRGLITRASASSTVTSGSIGTEGEGHFASANLGKDPVTNTIRWALYRASDGEWIGDVDTATSNAALSLDADHHSNFAESIMNADEYVAWPYMADDRNASAVLSPAVASRFGGVFNATYAGLQWFGNGGDNESYNRIVFSAPHNSEAVDLSLDAADSIVIPSTSEMRGLASSSTGLLIFTADKTYILRGNYRANFSLEELYPEGCLSSMSIVEYGGGVFWTSRVGMMFYDGATVRNLAQNSLGAYYTDSIRTFDVNSDRIYSFLHKDYLFVHFTAFDSAFKPFRYEPVYAEGIETTDAIADFDGEDWDPDFTTDDFKIENNVPIYWEPISLYDSTATTTTKVVPKWGNGGSNVTWGVAGTQYVWGPTRLSDGITFAVYLPTGAITTISNFDFRGATKIDTISGIKALMGVNIVYATSDIRPRLIDVDSVLKTNNDYNVTEDAALIENAGKSENTYIKGPDFYLQTKHYTVGDPVLRKWFRLIMLNMYLIDGGMRLDVVDMEDDDRIDIEKKRHKNWEVFEEAGYTWDEFEGFVLPRILSPNRSTWLNLQNKGLKWYNVTDAEFTRRKKKISWRYPSAGFRLYQMNKYRPSNYQTAKKPHTVIVDSWNLGFKPMRQSRV